MCLFILSFSLSENIFNIFVQISQPNIFWNYKFLFSKLGWDLDEFIIIELKNRKPKTRHNQIDPD